MIQTLDFVIQRSDAITKCFDKAKKESVLMFCMNMIERLSRSSESLRILLQDPSNYAKVEYSSGIIIRSVLLDYLITLNAFEILAKHSDLKILREELDSYCSERLSDSVSYTLEYFKSNRNNLSKEELDKNYAALIDDNHFLFELNRDPNGNPVLKNKKRPKSPKQLYNVVANSKYLKSYQSIYDAYFYYSKYDHFGNMFYMLSRKDIEERVRWVRKVINDFPKMLNVIILILMSINTGNSVLYNELSAIKRFSPSSGF